jgi:hypothetical protein
MNSHWLLVWNDLWFYLKWVPGPFFFHLVGYGLAKDKYIDQIVAFFAIGVFFTWLSVNS